MWDASQWCERGKGGSGRGAAVAADLPQDPAAVAATAMLGRGTIGDGAIADKERHGYRACECCWNGDRK